MLLIDARLPWARRYRVLSAVGYLLVLGVLSAAMGMLGVRPSAAQSANADVKVLAFEVVSVKPNKASGSSNVHISSFIPDGFSAVNASLKMLITSAYGSLLCD